MRRIRRSGFALLFALAACGGQKWPDWVQAVGDPSFVGGGPGTAVGTVDILPIDMQVWVGPESEKNPQELWGALDPMVAGAVAARLSERGYQVVAQMDWDGRYVAPDGQTRHAMAEPEVGATAYALSGFGQAQRQVNDGLLVPFLPTRLGQQTRSDATLYVGGWAFGGKDKGGMSTGAKVAIGVLAVAVVAVVVVAAIAGAKNGGGDGVGKVLGGAARGAGRAAGTAVKVAGRALRPIGRLAARTTAAMVRSGPEMFDATVHLLDAMGRSATHLEIYTGRPDYYRSSAPHSGRSAMFLEMTLVDNRTGKVLWHARQRFPASPARPAQVEKAVARLLAPLPAAR